MKTSTLLILLAGSLLASGPAFCAQTLGWQGFDEDNPNWQGASQFNAAVDPGTILGGIQFHTGDDLTYLTTISFANLITSESTLPATVRFSLYGGGSTTGEFGSLIADLGTVTTTAGDVSTELPFTLKQHLTIDSQVFLQPDTTYWIGMTNGNGGTIYTRWVGDDSVFVRVTEIQSELGWTALDAWGLMPYLDPDDPTTKVPFGMNVFADVVSIPEPSGFILSGLAGLLGMMRRKRKG